VDVGRFLKSDSLLKKPNGKQRAELTVKQIVRVLRMFLEWAQAQGMIETLPFPKNAMPKRKQRPVIESAAEQGPTPEALPA